MKTIVYSLLAFGLGAGTAAHAETYNWTGGAGSNNWQTEGNWGIAGSPNNANTAEVRIETTTSLGKNAGDATGYSLAIVSNSRNAHSLYVNIPRFMLLASNNKSLRIGDGGSITFGSAFTSSASNELAFTSSNSARRLWLSATSDLALRNDGSGTVRFGSASLQNDRDTVSTADSTFTFSGTGGWSFGANSYLGHQSVASGGEFDATSKVSVTLASDFTGTLTYGATLAAELKDLQVNNGTLVVNSAMNLTGSALVASGGTLGGTGTLKGNLQVEGNLRTGGPAASTLTIDGDLTLAASSSTALRLLAGGTADRISGTGILSLDGALVVSGTAPGDVISGIALYDGFSSVTGDFDSVSLFGTSLSNSGSGLWSGIIGEYQYEFNSATGMLSSGQVPEPSAVALVLGAAAVGIAVVRRRRRAA